MAKKKPTKPAKTPAKGKKRPKKAPPGGEPPETPHDPDAPGPGDVGANLTDNERRFVEEYLVDRVSAHAYRRVYPHCSYLGGRQRGHEMRHRPHVAAEIEAALQAQRNRTRVRADTALRELERIATSDVLDLFDPNTNNLRHPRHIPIDTRRVISSVKVSRERRTVTTAPGRNGGGQTTTTIVDTVVEYKLWNKNDALGKLAAYHGLNVSIPPLEALLNSLPPSLSQQIRQAIISQTTPPQSPTAPSSNGKHT